MRKQINQTAIIGIGVLMLFSIAQARILFQDDQFFDVDSEGILIDSVSDAGDVNIQFGNDGTDGEIKWSNNDSKFDFNSRIDVIGGVVSNGIIDFNLADSFRIREIAFGGVFSGVSAPTCDNAGELAVNTDNFQIYICSDAGTNNWSTVGGGGSATTLDEAYDNFGANPSTITVDGIQGQTGGITFQGNLASEETITIRNLDDGGAVLIENDGTGDSLRVSDTLADGTPFVVNTDGDIGVQQSVPQNPLDIEVSGDVVELGDQSGSDICIVFDDDDAEDHTLCWNDLEGGFEFSEPLSDFGVISTPVPPGPCGPEYSNAFWFDSNTGLVYVCDTSNGRNKWLSSTPNVVWGESVGNNCFANPSDVLLNLRDCPVSFGNGLGYTNSRNGFYLPQDVTITGVGFSNSQPLQQGCTVEFAVIHTPDSYNFLTTGSEVQLSTWPITGPNQADYFIDNLNVDVPGGSYIHFGPIPKNNCGQVRDYIMNLYYRQKGA